MAVLQGGVNDLGGTLMEETISRMAGSQHGSAKSVAELEAMAAAAGRPARQRTTLYGEVSQERQRGGPGRRAAAAGRPAPRPATADPRGPGSGLSVDVTQRLGRSSRCLLDNLPLITGFDGTRRGFARRRPGS